ncbi:MAG: universal stress protein [Candidatus Thorarchaeota archaeon]
MIGIDESEGSIKAAKRVIQIEKDSECKIIAFHSTLHRGSNSDAKDLEDHSENVFSEIKKLFDEANLSLETRLVTDQNAEDYIKKTVEKEQINLVVLGYNGKHGIIKRRILGSIPTEIMNNVLCDVLIVK